MSVIMVNDLKDWLKHEKLKTLLNIQLNFLNLASDLQGSFNNLQISNLKIQVPG